MAAPWGAIVQAIDHAMGRLQSGMGAGIKVAGGQHGGASQNTTAGSSGSATGNDGNTPVPQTKETSTPIAENTNDNAEVMPDTKGEGQEGDSDIGANVSETGEDASESSDSAGDMMSMLSDANAKESTDVSSDEGEGNSTGKAAAIMGGAKKWAEGASKGFANAGAIATGNKAAFSYTAQNDLGKATEAAKKVWENRRNKKEDASKTSDK